MGAGYGPNIVTDGLIFYTNARNRRSYSGSGTEWKDLSKNKFHGVLQNSPTWNYNSFILDGVNDKAEFPLVTSSRTNVTIQGWVYVQLNKKGTMFRMGGGANGYAIGQGGTNFDNTGNNLIVLFPNVRWAVTSYSFSTPGWYFVTLVLDGSSVPKVYVNNQYIGSYSGTIPAIPTANFYIGSTYGNSESTRYFDGQVSSCLVYNRELTIDEISQNYFATKNQYEKQVLLNSNLVSYFDAAIYDSYPGAGTTWTDLAENSNGTLTNGPTFSMDADGAINFIRSSNQYVSVGALSGSFASFTVDVWFYPTSISNYENVLDCNYGYSGTTGNTGPRLEMNSTGNIGWVYSNSSSNESYYAHVVLNSGLQANKWHHIAISYNGASNSSITYYNGANTNISRITVGSPTGFIGSINDLRFAQGFNRASYTQRGYDGKIAIVKIFNRSLTSDEIYQNFNAVRGRFGL